MVVYINNKTNYNNNNNKIIKDEVEDSPESTNSLLRREIKEKRKQGNKK